MDFAPPDLNYVVWHPFCWAGKRWWKHSLQSVTLKLHVWVHVVQAFSLNASIARSNLTGCTIYIKAEGAYQPRVPWKGKFVVSRAICLFCQRCLLELWHVFHCCKEVDTSRERYTAQDLKEQLVHIMYNDFIDTTVGDCF